MRSLVYISELHATTRVVVDRTLYIHTYVNIFFTVKKK